MDENTHYNPGIIKLYGRDQRKENWKVLEMGTYPH